MKTPPPAQPTVFGARHDLLGWYHPPDPELARDLGVVLCPPNGYEGLCVHWALRVLAERLAAQGIPTVRFDYHGTGDALGDDHAPDRVPAWLASIGEAVALLKAKTRVPRVALYGLRLGATLAAAFASDSADVHALILHAPCLTGRAYLRELKALALTSRGHDGAEPSANPNDVVMAGWLITEQTAAALGAIDLSKLPRLGAVKDVLLLGRDDMPPDAKVGPHLQKLGAAVTAGKTQGYAAFMQDALTSKLPEADFDQLIAWLVERSVPTPMVAARHEAPAQLVGDTFFEEPVVFGSDALFGVLTTPKSPAAGRPIVVFTNTAANHHVGTHRATVEMARALAGRGIASFRFDVGGIGDSPARPVDRPQNKIYLKATAGDVVEAVRFVVGRQFGQVTLTGLCSGGYLAFHAAVHAGDVKRVVLVNTGRWVWREGDSLEEGRKRAVPSSKAYLTRAMDPETWLRVAKGSVNVRLIAGVLAGRVAQQAKARASEVLARVLGPEFEPSEIPRGFLQLLERGGHALLVYSSDDGTIDELAIHLGPNLRRLRGHPNARMASLDASDHTLTTAKARRKLVEYLAQTVG